MLPNYSYWIHWHYWHYLWDFRGFCSWLPWFREGPASWLLPLLKNNTTAVRETCFSRQDPLNWASIMSRGYRLIADANFPRLHGIGAESLQNRCRIVTEMPHNAVTETVFPFSVDFSHILFWQVQQVIFLLKTPYFFIFFLVLKRKTGCFSIKNTLSFLSFLFWKE